MIKSVTPGRLAVIRSLLLLLWAGIFQLANNGQNKKNIRKSIQQVPVQIATDRKIKGKGNFPIVFIVASEQVFAHWEVIKTNLMALSFQLILSSSKSTSRLEYLLALFGSSCLL